MNSSLDKTHAKAHRAPPGRSEQSHMQGGGAVPQRSGLMFENGRAEETAL